MTETQPLRAAPAAGEYEVRWTPDPAAIDPDADLPPRYELVRDFGDGLLGPVFGVLDLESDRRLLRLEIVPARLVAEPDRARALREAVAAARRVVSAHVLRVRELGQLDDGRYFVTADQVRGETLAERLAREGTLHPGHALEITRQMLLGLASAHEQGVEHGALSPACVWLAGGTRKTDADPHGVAVRIGDFGLGQFARGVASKSADLGAVLRMLRTMVPADSQDGLGLEIERLVARQEDVDAIERFHDAAELRAGIEALLRRDSPAAAEVAAAPPPKRTAPRWALAPTWAAALAGVLGALALLEGFLLWRGRNVASAHESNVQDRTLEVTALRSQLGEQREQAERLARERDATLQAKTDAERAHEQRLAADRAREQELASERARLDGELQLARTDLERARALADSAGKDRAELLERVQLLETSDSPAARAVRGFDATLEAIERGRGDEAARRLAALENDGLPAPDFLRELASAASGLNRFERSREEPALDVEALRKAESSLARAGELRTSLRAESSAWLGLGDASGESRAQRAETALDSLARALASSRAAAAEADVADWSKIAAGKGVQPPAAAFAHAERFACDHLSELAQRFAAELTAWAVIEDALDVPRLQTFHQLPAWLERLHAGAATLPERSLRELELLERAQRWYDLDPDNDGGFDGASIERAAVAAQRKDWRNELYLQWRLSRPDSAFPIRRNATQIYRTVDADGAVEWWRESAEEASGDFWRIRRERLAADGSTAVGEGTLRVVRRGSEFTIPGATLPLLDVRAHGPSVLVSPHPSPYTGDLPGALAVDAAELARFRSERAGDPCLVYVQDDVRRWFSPRVGLVREETRTQRGWFARELVFAR